MLAGGVLLTLLMSALVAAMMQRARRVGRLVLERTVACRQNRARHDAGLGRLRGAANLVAGIRAVLAETGLAPSLEIELTERLFMSDVSLAATLLHAIRPKTRQLEPAAWTNVYIVAIKHTSDGRSGL